MACCHAAVAATPLPVTVGRCRGWRWVARALSVLRLLLHRPRGSLDRWPLPLSIFLCPRRLLPGLFLSPLHSLPLGVLLDHSRLLRLFRLPDLPRRLGLSDPVPVLGILVRFRFLVFPRLLRPLLTPVPVAPVPVPLPRIAPRSRSCGSAVDLGCTTRGRLASADLLNPLRRLRRHPFFNPVNLVVPKLDRNCHGQCLHIAQLLFLTHGIH
mmetsp:Transcript_29885/g.63601  ORF Transcript_29885/g.63601 Transcript_29885/m.63601 type:complete len:211 (-) Transcript_29885:1035-1667(-)